MSGSDVVLIGRSNVNRTGMRVLSSELPDAPRSSGHFCFQKRQNKSQNAVICLGSHQITIPPFGITLLREVAMALHSQKNRKHSIIMMTYGHWQGVVFVICVLSKKSQNHPLKRGVKRPILPEQIYSGLLFESMRATHISNC